MNTILAVAMKETTKALWKEIGKSALIGAIEGVVIGAGWFGAEQGLNKLKNKRAAKKAAKKEAETAKAEPSNVVVEA